MTDTAIVKQGSPNKLGPWFRKIKPVWQLSGDGGDTSYAVLHDVTDDEPELVQRWSPRDEIKGEQDFARRVWDAAHTWTLGQEGRRTLKLKGFDERGDQVGMAYTMILARPDIDADDHQPTANGQIRMLMQFSKDMHAIARDERNGITESYREAMRYAREDNDRLRSLLTEQREEIARLNGVITDLRDREAEWLASEREELREGRRGVFEGDPERVERIMGKFTMAGSTIGVAAATKAVEKLDPEQLLQVLNNLGPEALKLWQQFMTVQKDAEE